MKKTITSLGIDKVKYEFTLGEILDALLKAHKIILNHPYEFDIYENGDSPYAELVIDYVNKVETHD